MRKIRVLLVDDQKLFVQSLKDVMEARAPDIEVVGIAYTGEEACEIASRSEPDVILMDVRMPELDGLGCLRRIKEALGQAKIMMLSTFDDNKYVTDAVNYGACGYMLKNVSPNELIDAIRVVNKGHILFSAEVAARLSEASRKPQPPLSPAKGAYPEWYQSLTGRELDILKLLTLSYSNSEIAERLFIGEQTIRNYVSAIYSKMNVKDRSHAIRLARSVDMGTFGQLLPDDRPQLGSPLD